MKHNLKNKPNLLDEKSPHYWRVNVQDPDAVSEQLHELQYWFEGFETELREIMADTPNNRPDLAVVYIRQILGE